jgi:hypothetical protein
MRMNQVNIKKNTGGSFVAAQKAKPLSGAAMRFSRRQWRLGL